MLLPLPTARQKALSIVATTLHEGAIRVKPYPAHLSRASLDLTEASERGVHPVRPPDVTVSDLTSLR